MAYHITVPVSRNGIIRVPGNVVFDVLNTIPIVHGMRTHMACYSLLHVDQDELREISLVGSLINSPNK